MTGTSDDEEGKWKNRSTTLRRLGRQYSPDVTPEVASRRLKQWIVGNPVLLGLLHENGWTASRHFIVDCQFSFVNRPTLVGCFRSAEHPFGRYAGGRYVHGRRQLPASGDAASGVGI